MTINTAVGNNHETHYITLFFEGTITDQAYLEMTHTFILSAVYELYENDEFSFQQDSAQPLYHDS